MRFSLILVLVCMGFMVGCNGKGDTTTPKEPAPMPKGNPTEGPSGNAPKSGMPQGVSK